MRDLEVCYLPAQWRGLESTRLQNSTCVVIDVIRATTTLCAALANGALGVRPVAGIEEAFALKSGNPSAILAGERGGKPVPGFDLGNSPREMTAERVAGHEMILTTTNGTQALAACAGAREVMTAGFVNLAAVVRRLKKIGPPWIVLCAGYEGAFGLDDAIVAGALAEALEQGDFLGALYHSVRGNLTETFLNCQAGRELLKVGLGDDIPECVVPGRYNLVPTLDEDGVLRAR